MKILFISQRVPYPPNRGDKIRTYNLIKHLVDNKHDVTVACPINEKSEITSIKAFENKLAISVIHQKLNAKFFRYTKALVFNKPLSVVHFYSRFLQEKISIKIKEQCDLIICSSSGVAEYVLKNSHNKHLGIPFIVDFMDLDSDKWQQYSSKSTNIFWKMIYQREANLISNYEKKIQSQASSCVFTSEKEVELFSKYLKNPKNLITIGNGLDTAYFSATYKTFNSTTPTFIFVGVMDYLPNENAVIWFTDNVWGDIKKAYPQAKFIIAGMNPTKNIIQLQKLPGVTVTGFVEDIRDYYQKANIFVAPLWIARGVQNKVLEAFACNIPVVCTPNAIQGIECVPETHVLQASTKQQFIDQINRLVEDVELRENLQKSALELIHNKYTWQGQLQKLDKLINEVLT